ncbi:LCP family protein [Actinacidiphila sp. ITFR-21]|uniref:LCP family protein n=1 Tax=Actinacidiphila sp. ITFR-21 TaxID=3075199 RepID=UPI0028895EE6|nr:LCP family protein [Streptomyces sp. ITFR-21]WNI15790.1 LCP family protein [Streptomyces sp. ITFR-21]
MDAQGPDFVDPADQWVLDPATGTYQLRLGPADPAARQEPPQPAAEAPPGPARPPGADRAAPAAPGRGGRRAAAPPGRRRRKARKSGNRPLLWAAGAAGVALVAGGVAVLASGHSAGNRVGTVDIGDAGARTLSSSGPMNLLLIGAADAPTGGAGAADTTILLHVAADRSNATAVGIPGDVVTGIPDCPTVRQGGGTRVVPGSPQHAASPTAADSLGVDGRDPGCAVRLVEQLTGVRVDHFLMLGSARVRALSTAADGAGACFAELPADPARLRTLAAAKALTVDTPLGSETALDGLSGQLGKVDAGHLTFTTLPTKANPADPAHATVVVDRDKAAQLFSLVRNDVPLSGRPAAPDPRLVGPRTTPHDTRVTVLNGSGVFGASQDVLNWLQNDEGVNRSANGGDAPAPLARTTLAYAPNQADQARSLAAMMGLPATALHQGTADAKPLAYMTLTLGADYTAPGTPIGPPTSPPKGLRMTTADRAGCAVAPQ